MSRTLIPRFSTSKHKRKAKKFIRTIFETIKKPEKRRETTSRIKRHTRKAVRTTQRIIRKSKNIYVKTNRFLKKIDETSEKLYRQGGPINLGIKALGQTFYWDELPRQRKRRKTKKSLKSKPK